MGQIKLDDPEIAQFTAKSIKTRRPIGLTVNQKSGNQKSSRSKLGGLESINRSRDKIEGPATLNSMTVQFVSRTSILSRLLISMAAQFNYFRPFNFDETRVDLLSMLVGQRSGQESLVRRWTV